MKKINLDIKKILPYFLYIILLCAQIYAIFIWKAQGESSRYFKILIGSFVLYAATGILLTLSNIIKKALYKKMILLLISLSVIIQLFIFPIANIYSRTLPVWPPRGSVYQYPSLRPTASLNEFSLFLNYYLDGKTLYASNADDPSDFDNAAIYIHEKYNYIEEDMKTLSNDEIDYFLNSNKQSFYNITVNGDTKREIPGFSAFIYAIDDYVSYDDIDLYKDSENNWYLLPSDIAKKALYE